MKISVKVKDFLKIFPQYQTELFKLKEDYSNILEEHKFKLEQIKDKKIKSVFELQLGTKEDFNLVVQLDNKDWSIKDYNSEIILPLILRDEKIVLDWDTKSLENVDLIDFIEKTYKVNASRYEGMNYVGEGKINWNSITEDIKENWNNSLFFLDKMKNEQFVENNKNLILKKVIDNDELLKEAILKSTKFFKHALDNIAAQKLLLVLSDKSNYLAEIWNTKIKDILKNSDYESLMKEAKIQMNEELNNYFEFIAQNSSRYGDFGDMSHYEKLKERLFKDLKTREKEIKKEVEENQKSRQEIYQLLEDKNLKSNLIKGLLNSEMFKEDFKYFEEEIIHNDELKSIVIKKGLYNTLATSKNFVDSLNNEELLEFIQNCNRKLSNAFFKSDDIRHFKKIVSEEKLIEILKNSNTNLNWEILKDYETTNKELKKYLFKINPKENFNNLSKSEIENEDIQLYLKAGGYLEDIKSKVNIYQITDIETIKLLCQKHNEVLGSKKAPVEWKTNPEIIQAAMSESSSLKNVELSKENVQELSKDIDFVLEIVSKDKSHTFYKNLPEKLKNNRQVALSLLNTNSEIEEIIKLLPTFVLQDKRCNIELIKQNPKAIEFLKENIWDDKEFVLTLFNEMKESAQERDLKKHLPNKIKLFLETFNIEENYYTFFNNYYLQKKLKEKLVNETPRLKEKKLKI